MAVINDVLAMVDNTVTGVAAGAYGDVVSAVNPIVVAASVLIMALSGAGLVTQAIPLSYRTFLGLGLRIVLINIFLNFSNLEGSYLALTNGPGEFGATMLSALSDGEVSNLYEGLDALYLRALGLGDAVAQNGGMVAGPVASVVLFLIAALMATVTIIVLSAAKIMLAALLVIAPLMICCTFFKQSAPLFEAWVKMAIGFAFVPLFVAAMSGFTMAAAEVVAPEGLGDVDRLSASLSFLVVMMLGTGLMWLVPTFAQSIAATNLGIGALAARSVNYPGDALRAGIQGSRGAYEGFQGRGPSDRHSLVAQGTNLAGQGARLAVKGTHAAVSMGAKMVRSGGEKRS